MILLHYAAARANYQIRCVSPGGVAQFAHHHDEQIWDCACNILQLDPRDAEVGREFSTLPLSMGGLGLRSASRLREPAFWASWADCLAMIRQRHPEVAAQLVDQLEGFPDTPVLQAASTAARSLHGVMGFEPPSWHALAVGVRPEPQPEEFEIRSQGGWQHEAASRIERRFRDVISSAGWMTQPSPCCDHRVALVLVWQCRRAPHVTRMEHSCSDDPASPAASPPSLTVRNCRCAFHSTNVAITVRVVLGQSWGSGVAPWKA